MYAYIVNCSLAHPTTMWIRTVVICRSKDLLALLSTIIMIMMVSLYIYAKKLQVFAQLIITHEENIQAMEMELGLLSFL